MRRTATLTVTLAVACAMLAAPSAAAQVVDPPEGQSTQNSTSCTRSRYAPSGHMCLYLNGTGTWPNYARVIRNTLPYTNQNSWLCDYRSQLRFRYPSGNVITHYSGRHNGCTWNTAWFQYGWYSYVPKGTLVCGAWWTSNRRYADGIACNRIG